LRSTIIIHLHSSQSNGPGTISLALQKGASI
jgi:hypothetical protein